MHQNAMKSPRNCRLADLAVQTWQCSQQQPSSYDEPVRQRSISASCFQPARWDEQRQRATASVRSTLEAKILVTGRMTPEAKLVYTVLNRGRLQNREPP